MSDLVEAVRSIIDGIARGNPQALLQLLSDRVEWNEAENGPYWAGAAFVGRDAIMANVFARIQHDFQDLHLTVRQVVGCGNAVLAGSSTLTLGSSRKSLEPRPGTLRSDRRKPRVVDAEVRAGAAPTRSPRD